MRIKRTLPAADPRTATKTIHDSRFLGEGINTYIHKPSPSPMDDFGQSEESRKKAGRTKKQEMERRHKIMKTLLNEGGLRCGDRLGDRIHICNCEEDPDPVEARRRRSA